MAVEVLLGLDVGSVRIGVAMARSDVRIASPLTVVAAGPPAVSAISELVSRQQAATVVVGWPRGMDGQSTSQTAAVEAFVDELRGQLAVPVVLQDEALTSQKAEDELQARGKPYDKGDVDSLAATYILEDYLVAQERRAHV